jgi:hypothetical protein
VNKAVPQPEDSSGSKDLAPGPPRGPGFCPLEDANMGVVVSVPRSSDIVDFGPNVLGLPGYPRAPPMSVDWRQVEGGAELTCSQVAATRCRLKETLVIVDQDVLQPTRLVLRWKGGFLPGFLWSFLGFLTSSLA